MNSSLALRFIPTKPHNPCPICSDLRGKCRQSGSLRLCMTLTDGRETVPGFKFLGLTKDGLWGKWIEQDDGSWNEADRLRWRKAQNQKRQRQAAREAEQRAIALSARERDRLNRALLEQLTLDPRDRADLQRRGFQNEAIERSQFRSVEPYQKLALPLSQHLPGVQANSRSLNVSGAGYLCPVRDKDGLIVAFQLRLRNPGEGGRYRWLSSRTEKRENAPTPHLWNGELPLAVFRPETLQQRAIALVEGTGPKPALTCDRLGMVTLGAAGGQFASSPNTWKATLEQLSQELQGSQAIWFFPDAGAVANPQVCRQYQQTWALLAEWGYEVQIGWWGQICKTQPDVDELADLAAIDWITVQEFQQIALLNGGMTEAALSAPDLTDPETERRQRQQENFWAETRRIQSELNSLRIEPHLTASGRYIPSDLVTLPEKPGIILVDASMGTGKTSTVLKRLFEEHRARHGQALQWLFSNRNLLLLQSCSKLDLTHHTQIGRTSNRFQGGSCFESIGAIDLDHIPDAPPLIAIDEPSQTFKQILQGDTCRESQPFILQRTRQFLRKIAEKGGHIVLTEDGLTNLELDFIAEASGLEVVQSVKFTQTHDRPGSYLVYPSPSLTWQEMLTRYERGENLCVASDSQKWLEDTQRWLEKLGIESTFIHGKNSNEPWAKECIANPDRWIATHKPRIFGYSPSMGAGVSIDDSEGWFSALAFHLTHLEPREAKQLPLRLRTQVPRFGYVRASGTKDDELFSGSRPEVILRNLRRNKEGILKLTQFAELAIQQSNEETDLIKVLGRLEQDWDNSQTDLGFYLKYWSRYRARETYNKLALRTNLIQLWQNQGHQVEVLEEKAIQELHQKRQQIRHDLNQEQAIAWAKTQTHDLTVSRARDILARPGSTEEQRLAARKRLMEDKLPGTPLDDSQFVLKAIIENNGKFLRATELFWLSQHPGFAQQLDRWSLSNTFSQAARRDQIIIVHRLPMRSAQAQLLHDCPLQPFIQGEVEKWTNHSPEAQAVHEWAVLHARQLWRYLRLTVKSEHRPVKTVNKLLRSLGLEVKQQGWQGRIKGNPGERIYVVTNLQDHNRDLILEALTERFLKRLQDKEETPPNQRTIATLVENSHQTDRDQLSGFPDWIDRSPLLKFESPGSKPTQMDSQNVLKSPPS